MKRLLSTVALLTCLTTFSYADQPAADTIPADSLACFSFKGSHHLGNAYDSSHLKSVLDASTFPKFYHELMPQLLQKSLDQDPKEAEELASALSAVEIVGRQGFTLYARPIAPGADVKTHAPFSLTLTIDAHEEADALEKLARHFVDSAKDPQLTLRRTGTTLTLLQGPAGQDNAPALATSSAFSSALKQVDSDPVLLLYVDFEHILPLIDQTFASDRPSNPWPKVKPLTGLDRLKRYILTGSFSPDGGWSTQSFTHAPAPRTGWLSLLHGDALPASLLSRIPADATYVRVGHFDPVGWIDNARKIVATAAGPDAQQKFDQVFGLANLYIGRNITTDILAPLGTDWAIYTSPTLTGKQPMGAILISKIKDEATLNGGLISLTYAIANTCQNPRIRSAGLSATAAQGTFSGVNVTYLKLTLPNPQLANLSPAWTIKDSHLYFGFSPESVAAAATYAGPAFPDSPALADARKFLPPHAPETSLEFAAIQPEYVQSLRTAIDAGIGIAAANGIKLPANPLPSAAAIAPHLRPLLSVSWSDADGFHTKSTSPFPGSSFLTPTGLTSIGGSALATSALLPSLNRAREAANRVKCAANMKQISNAILLYSNEHKGHYPPDLGILVTTEEIPTPAFVCPDTTSHRIDPTGLTPDQLRERVSATSDYIYVGQALTQAANPHTLVLYEQFDHHTDGCNMLFADGSVSFHLRADAERIIAAGKLPDRD